MKSSSPIGIVIVDDYPLYRSGIKHFLSDNKHVKIISEAANFKSVLGILKTIKPEIVIAGLSLAKTKDELLGIKHVTELYPDIKIITMVDYSKDEVNHAKNAIDVGAVACIPKSVDKDTLSLTLDEVYLRGTCSHDLTQRALLERIRRVDLLTDKEETLLRLICEGKNAKEIGDMFGLSPRTIEAMRDKVKVKVGVKSIAGLVSYAFRSGIYEAVS